MIFKGHTSVFPVRETIGYERFVESITIQVAVLIGKHADTANAKSFASS